MNILQFVMDWMLYGAIAWVVAFVGLTTYGVIRINWTAKKSGIELRASDLDEAEKALGCVKMDVPAWVIVMRMIVFPVGIALGAAQAIEYVEGIREYLLTR